MSVLDRRYHRWPGEPTSYLERVLVIPRYAFADLVRRRVVVTLWVLALVPPFLLALLTYFAANLETFRQAMPWLDQIPVADMVGRPVFGAFTAIQFNACIVLALFAGPRIIAQDMANGALPLLLATSLRRSDYVLAKCSVLFLLLSSVSWVPLLLVVGLRGTLDLPSIEGLPLAVSVTLVSLAFVLFLTVLTCAISAHVKRTWLVPFLLLGVLFTTAAFGGTVNAVTGTSRIGTFFSPLILTGSLHEAAFPDSGAPRRAPHERPLPLPVALLGLTAWTGGLAVLLVRRVRSVEVVR